MRGGGFGGSVEYGEWDDTVVEQTLPIKILSNEDAMNTNYTLKLKEAHMNHPILVGLDWDEVPALRGDNQIKSKGKVLAVNPVTEDPVLVVSNYSKGRVVAFA